MSKNYTGGLNFSWPTKGDTNTDGEIDTALTGISDHDHSGAPNGVQLSSTAFVNDGINGTKIRLQNAEYLRARNAAANGDLNLLRATTGDLLAFGRAFLYESFDPIPLTSSGAIPLTTSITVLNGATLAMTLANGVEGQVKLIVNIASTPATVTPATTSGANTVSLAQHGCVAYNFLSGEWRAVPYTNCRVTDGQATLQISRTQPSPTSLVTNTAKDIGTTPSLTLTPGVWQVAGAVSFLFGATTTVTYMEAAVTKTSNTLPAVATLSVPTAGEIRIGSNYPTGYTPNSGGVTHHIPSFRVTVTTNTPLFLDAYATFATSTCSAYGFLEAVPVP